MKCAILFAFAAFAFLAQADARASLFDNGLFNNDIIERGRLAEMFKEKLIAAKEKLDSMIEQAQNTLKEKLTEAQQKADQLIEQLKDKAHAIKVKIFTAAKEILDKVSEFEDKLVEQAHNVLNKHDYNDVENEIETDKILLSFYA